MNFKRKKFKKLKETFDSYYVSSMKELLFEDNGAPSPANSDMGNNGAANATNPNIAGNAGVGAMGSNPAAHQKVAPNSVKPTQPQKIDPKFISALQNSHNPQVPHQTQSNVDALMNQPNAPMIDQNSDVYKDLPQEVQQALINHSNQKSQTNNIQKNNQQNQTNTPVKPPQQPVNTTAKYMPQQNVGSPPQSNASMGSGV